jgi:N-carbamoylputrescine amidase
VVNKKPVRVVGLQMACSDNPEENLTRTVEQIYRAAESGANVVCLQELFANRYPCQSEDHDRFALAETIPGPTTQRLGQLAREHNIVIVASLFERRAAGLYHNTAVVLDADGSQAGLYRKMHIPDDPFYYEKFYFTPGDLGFQSFETRFGRVGVCVCWDQWFPEAARLTALSGAQFLVFPTAIGWLNEEKSQYGQSQTEAWKTMIRSHAIANGIYVMAVNRVGIEDDLEFWGESFVTDPYGQVIAQADGNEQAVAADCELATIDAARTHWPFLRDRRIDAYDGLGKRFLDDE